MEIRHFNPGDHVNPVKIVVFTYDKVGNLLTYDDGVTSGEYFYDNAYRKVSKTVNYGAFTKTPLTYSIGKKQYSFCSAFFLSDQECLFYRSLIYSVRLGPAHI